MDVMAFLDAMSSASARDRSSYHLTLGQLVDALTEADQDAPVVFDYDAELSPSAPDSYRGYYSDLSFPPAATPITVKELLIDARRAIGDTFMGYKGGYFKMDTDTPLWASAYGSSSGKAIMGLSKVGDSYVLLTKQID